MRIAVVTTIVFFFFTHAHGAQDPWNQNQMMEPQELVQILKAPGNDQGPVILHIGFQFLFKNAHIPGSKYVGPANEEAGLKHLRDEMDKVPRTREVIIYCGCCPFKKCPNVHPAFKELQAMGFKNLKVLSLPDNFKKNWIEKGFPVEKQSI